MRAALSSTSFIVVSCFLSSSDSSFIDTKDSASYNGEVTLTNIAPVNFSIIPCLQSNVMNSSRQNRRLAAASVHWLLDQYIELVAAVRFLTVLPLPEYPQRFDDDTVSLRVCG